MTQKAISDLKLMKSIFFHKRQNYSKKYGGGNWNSGYNNSWTAPKSQSYWDNLNQEVKTLIRQLPVNPLKLDTALRKMIDKGDRE